MTSVTYSPRLVDHGGAVEYVGGWDAQIDDGPKLSLEDVRSDIRNLERDLSSSFPHRGNLEYRWTRRLELLKDIERRLTRMCTQEPADIRPDAKYSNETTFAAGESGYYIQHDGTVWQHGHSAWISKDFGGKRRTISDLSAGDRLEVERLISLWQCRGAKGASAPQTPPGMNGPSEPPPPTEWLGKHPEPIRSIELTLEDGRPAFNPLRKREHEPVPTKLIPTSCLTVFEEAPVPWNELGPFRIHDNGTVECIDVGVIVSTIATGILAPERVHQVSLRSDTARDSHDELVRRWEARQVKSDFDRVIAAVPAMDGFEWRQLPDGTFSLYWTDDNDNEYALTLPDDAMTRKGNELVNRAYDILHPQKGNGTPE